MSIPRDREELVTDDAAKLKEQLQAVTGERISVLEGVGEGGRFGSRNKARDGEMLPDPRCWIRYLRWDLHVNRKVLIDILGL